jgi:excisionase family DNA binding protein
MARKSVTYEQAMAELMSKATIAVHPTCSTLLGTGKSATYAAAASGQIESIKVGGRRRIPTAPLRKKLGIEAE